MSRGYPRFIFSNPTNTRDKGPFIVHTLYPRMIFKVNDNINNLQLTLVEQWDETPEPYSANYMKASNAIQQHAMEWLIRQILEKSISPDFTKNFTVPTNK